LPSDSPQTWLSAAAVRELDRLAIATRGVPSALLMENAGRAVAGIAARRLERGGAPALILVGPGNNGGDGLVVARTLVNRGFRVRVCFVGNLARLRDLSADVQLNARLWRDMESLGDGVGRLTEIQSHGDLQALQRFLGAANVVIDAMFGTGLTRALRSPWSDVVRAVNATDKHVIAVDVPSGLDADLGEVVGGEQGVAICASETVTFVVPKRGLVHGAGPALTGTLTVAEIGIPIDLVRAALQQARLSSAGEV
jgi:ADP-dependent NAD(P)H-hydrate dehydratase / NAD(P)H-hydrate epimerase